VAEATARTPIPHWPGERVALGAGREVFVRTAPPVPPDEPILYVHGLAGSATNWTDVMALLGGCAIDLPGFGWSPPPAGGDYSIDAHAAAVVGLIRARGDGPVHLFGNSLGGAVATRVASRCPDLVRTLTLISPALPDLRPRVTSVRVLVGSSPGLGPLAIRRIAALPPEVRVRGTLRLCFADPSRAHPDRVAELVEELRHRDGTDHARPALLGSARGLVVEYLRRGARSLWREAAAVRAPVLLIYGRHDRLVDPRMAARASRTFRDSRAVVLPDAGHVAQMELPESVAGEFRALLEGLSAAPAAPSGDLSPQPPGGVPQDMLGAMRGDPHGQERGSEPVA
jgi:pimeloyl-ACP methyl ester carboxylesterase